MVFVFFQHVLDRFVNKDIMSLSHAGDEDFDFLHEFSIQGVIINYSFAHSVTIPL